MAIQFFSIQQLNKTLKVTIQKTGRLGFTSQTALEMKIDTNTYFRFGKDETMSDVDLIMVKLPTSSNDAFRAVKSGDYYYLPTSLLFEMLQYDYKKDPIIFDVKRAAHLDAEAGGEAYLMTRRASKGRKPAKKETATVTKSESQLLFPDEE